MQELRCAAEAGEELLQQLSPSPSEALSTAHKLAHSMTNSMIQSDATLTMCPQQQALCTVCHALIKGGLSQHDVLDRYASKACSLSQQDAEAQPADSAVKKALQVRFSAQC